MKEKQFDISKLKKISKDKCFICKNQIAKEDIIYEDKNFIAFLDLYPPTKGYTLLATKKHVENVTELSDNEYIKLQKILFKIAKSIEKNFNPKKICLLQSGDLVTHYHFHIIPMYGNPHNNFIDVLLKRSILELSKEERKDIVSKIKNKL